MPYIRPGVRRLFDLMLHRRDIARRDVDAEIALHLELRVEQLVRQGMPREDAEREARRRFGQVENAILMLEETAHQRDRRMTFRDWLDSTLQDARYALRGLRREPTFTVFAVATLALGIGANAAMYGIVDRLLLRGPEHIIEPERVVRFTTTVTRPQLGDVTYASAGYVLYDNLRAHVRAFEDVAAYKDDGNFTLGRGREARNIRGGAATANFFTLLGVHAARGRFFQADEDGTTNPARVVVLGDAFWRGQYGADPSIIGQVIQLNNEPHTVIGVAPRGFTGVQLGRIDAWVPMSLYSKDVTTNWPRAWNAQWLNVIGRMKPGVTLRSATEDATRTHRATYDGPPTRLVAMARIDATPIRFTDQGKESTEVEVSRWLIGVTLVVLLIACSNVANLLLARAIRRQGEVGVRMALGAGRGRLARLFVTESLVIATLGGLAALAVAAAISVLVRQALLPNVEWTSSPVSARVLLVALAVTLAVGVAVGLAPAAFAARSSLQGVIQRGRAQGRRFRTGAWPTVLQATLTACLLIGAGLFVRSLHRARTTPLGFDSDRILVASVAFTNLGDATDEERRTARARRIETLRRALAELQQRRDVEGAAIAVGSPFGNAFGIDLFVPGYDSLPKLPGGGPYVSAVTSDYFTSVGTRLLRGRTFLSTEGDGTEPVTIVNETMARTLWPQQDALGKCIRIGADTAPCAQVVGVVEEARRYDLKEDPAMQYYIPYGQERGFGGSVLMIRPRGMPKEFAATAIKAVEAIDASIDRVTAWPIRDKIDPLLRPWKLGATVFTLGGVLALLVAALGLYSVMSYSVAQRTHEMGVRIALGARTRSIVGMILRQGMALAAIGIGFGIVVAIAAGSRLRSLLFDTSPQDMTVIGSAAGVLLLAAMAASVWPALRAGRVDPMRALKTD
ncbi:MAG TPA: ABC transporter permease [Gemmatimonadaceae bacterium]|nr:ABC transporter permease [Gemmatimonadaceae bacterium]